MSKAERLKLIRERLDDPTVKPFQTDSDLQAAKGNRNKAFYVLPLTRAIQRKQEPGS